MSGGTLQIQGGAVCIQLNPNCLEAPSYQGFTAELQFTLNDNKTIIVFGELSQCNNGVSGFKFSLKRELELETIPVTITFVSVRCAVLPGGWRAHGAYALRHESTSSLRA